MTNVEIDAGVDAVISILRLVSLFSPRLRRSLPLVSWILHREASKLKAGIADGSIIPDGQGGLIPAHGQSEVDPVTGFFTGRKT